MLRVCIGFLLGLSAAAQDYCVSFEKAKELVGKEACIVGRVTQVGESRAGNVFVNFCKDYRNCAFSAVALHAGDSDELGDLRDLEGKILEMRGTIKLYKGQPEMELKSRAQLRLAKDQAKLPLDKPEPEDMRARMHNFGNKPHVPGGFGRRGRTW